MRRMLASTNLSTSFFPPEFSKSIRRMSGFAGLPSTAVLLRCVWLSNSRTWTRDIELL